MMTLRKPEDIAVALSANDVREILESLDGLIQSPRFADNSMLLVGLESARTRIGEQCDIAREFCNASEEPLLKRGEK